jgi:LysR family transcriptional regulator, transcriptional activator of nhaA
MEWLNYHHLFYFSAIAKEGGLAAAARKLRLTHSTLSAQLRALEEHFGTPLFERRGKRLVLTPFGVEAASYASDIFRLGSELDDVARGRAQPGREVLRVGVVAGLPKTLVHHLLAPALDRLDDGAAIIRQDAELTLIEALAAGRLHVVLLNDIPTTPPGARIHAHALGETDILLYGRADLARIARRRFPRSLSGLPLILPASGAPLRRRLDEWFSAQNVEVTIRAEVDDAGLLRAFGSAGRGIFPVRAALKAEVEDLHDVQPIGRCEGIRERFYAVTTERRIKHPVLAALVDKARADLHAPGPAPT